MTGLRLFLLSRSALGIVAFLVAMSGLAFVLWRFSVEINVDFVDRDPARQIPAAELVPVVTGCVLAAWMRPPFYEWERLGAARIGWYGTAATLVGIAAPLLPMAAAVIRLPAEATWQYIPANVLVVTAVAFVLCALLGPITGTVSALALFVAACLAQNLFPEAVGLLPLSAPPSRQGTWLAALVAVVIAVVIQLRTRGASTWSRQWVRNED